MSQPLLSTTFYLPESFEGSRRTLIDEITKIKSLVNRNTRGEFFLSETNSAQVLFGGTSNNRPIFRKTFDFGALPNTAAKNLAHGLTFDANMSFVKITAVATDPVNFLSFPIPTTGVTISLDATNIIITTTSDLTAYTNCFVILEYIKA